MPHNHIKFSVSLAIVFRVKVVSAMVIFRPSQNSSQMCKEGRNRHSASCITYEEQPVVLLYSDKPSVNVKLANIYTSQHLQLTYQNASGVLTPSALLFPFSSQCSKNHIQFLVPWDTLFFPYSKPKLSLPLKTFSALMKTSCFCLNENSRDSNQRKKRFFFFIFQKSCSWNPLRQQLVSHQEFLSCMYLFPLVHANMQGSNTSLLKVVSYSIIFPTVVLVRVFSETDA